MNTAENDLLKTFSPEQTLLYKNFLQEKQAYYDIVSSKFGLGK